MQIPFGHALDPDRPTGIAVCVRIPACNRTRIQRAKADHGPHHREGGFPKTSQTRPTLLQPQVHTPNEAAKASIMPQAIVDGFHLQVNQPVITLIEGAFETLDALRTLTEARVNKRSAIVGRVM